MLVPAHIAGLVADRTAVFPEYDENEVVDVEVIVIIVIADIEEARLGIKIAVFVSFEIKSLFMILVVFFKLFL